MSEMQTAVDGVGADVEDTFAALMTMIPTMNEYFEQWKLSAFVSGEASDPDRLRRHSRLFDVTGILHGLDVTYDEIGPLDRRRDPDLHAQIDAGSPTSSATSMISTSRSRAESGSTPEQAISFGTEAQATGDAAGRAGLPGDRPARPSGLTGFRAVREPAPPRRTLSTRHFPALSAPPRVTLESDWR